MTHWNNLIGTLNFKKKEVTLVPHWSCWPSFVHFNGLLNILLLLNLMSSALFFHYEHRDKILKSFFFFFYPSFQFSRILQFLWIKRHLVWSSFLLVGVAHYPTHLGFLFDLWCCTCFLFISFFWLCWVLLLQGLSLVAEHRGCSSSQYPGFSLLWLLLLWSS